MHELDGKIYIYLLELSHRLGLEIPSTNVKKKEHPFFRSKWFIPQEMQKKMLIILVSEDPSSLGGYQKTH